MLSPNNRNDGRRRKRREEEESEGYYSDRLEREDVTGYIILGRKTGFC
jgi:hypothetical protein